MRLTRQEAKRIKQWLYSIRKTEYAIEKLKEAIDNLESRRASPPAWMSNPEAIPVSGGTQDNRMETWVEFLDTYDARKSFLEDKLAGHQVKVRLYYDTLEALKLESYLGGEIIRLKFYQGIKPDAVIYSYHLFCAEKTFYRALPRALQYFIDVVPEITERR